MFRWFGEIAPRTNLEKPLRDFSGNSINRTKEWKWQMKRLVSTAVILIILVLLVVAGCDGKESVSPLPEEGQEVVSSCVTCHTDKDLLKEVAATEPTEEKSEATSGEG